MTPDYQRGVEAALAAIMGGSSRDLANEAGHGVTAQAANYIRRALADRIDALLTETPAPAPAAVASTGAVSEGDVERALSAYCEEVVRATDGRIGYEVPRPDGMRAVVAAIRAEATPPVDLVRDAWPSVSIIDTTPPDAARSVQQEPAEPVDQNIAGAEAALRRFGIYPVERAQEPAEPVRACGSPSPLHGVKGTDERCELPLGHDGVHQRGLAGWRWEPAAEPVRAPSCGDLLNLGDHGGTCIRPKGHDGSHDDGEGLAWSDATSDEEGGRHVR